VAEKTGRDLDTEQNYLNTLKNMGYLKTSEKEKAIYYEIAFGKRKRKELPTDIWSYLSDKIK
ncbi:MAG: hypothetical protein ACE5J3_02235, partial [Methanosarcinales archaeon]